MPTTRSAPVTTGQPSTQGTKGTQVGSAPGTQVLEHPQWQAAPSVFQRWRREILIAVVQLAVLVILLAVASRWSSNKTIGKSSSGTHVAMPRINPFGGKGAQEGAALEGGAFRTQDVVERAIDFASPSGPSWGDEGMSEWQRERDAQDPSVKDFTDNVAAFGVPVISGAEVSRAVERKDGPYVVRELYFSAEKGVAAVSRHYVNVFRNRGYKMQETRLGDIDGLGRELVGSNGENRVVAKVRVDDTGRAVHVTLRQRALPEPTGY